ncbi:hypothetical protein RvY_03930 [Ramazzottius varieornatus]|uniref:Uncharacterized protein n=1 Tax=Ramazzottius varieornatus TaxID=947166 RepID=A0A1D1UPS6_RAMVA|nr:hypothetical protein RvY_03930 [Ramazzottius varieornatus]
MSVAETSTLSYVHKRHACQKLRGREREGPGGELAEKESWQSKFKQGACGVCWHSSFIGGLPSIDPTSHPIQPYNIHPE